MFEHQQLAFPPLSQGDASLAMLWRRLWEGLDGLVAPSAGCPTQAVPSEPRAGCCPHSPGAAGARAGLQAAGAAGSVPPVSRTCRTGEYEQLSDVNQHGPNSCFSCPHSSVCSLVLLAVLNPSSQSRGLAVPTVLVFPVRHWQHSELEPACSAGLPGAVLAHRQLEVAAPRWSFQISGQPVV